MIFLWPLSVASIKAVEPMLVFAKNPFLSGPHRKICKLPNIICYIGKFPLIL
ncbi:hypothetical protein D1BOALGB6SA_10183 [Olavius sp. associated proteobacterium Delta 1]|nr:hypothetical protein D1BOALGB6SA_10183 [Olavius sp. associated proteobacterium Delta 1]